MVIWEPHAAACGFRISFMFIENKVFRSSHEHSGFTPSGSSMPPMELLPRQSVPFSVGQAIEKGG
jgi:hypothetical protein